VRTSFLTEFDLTVKKATLLLVMGVAFFVSCTGNSGSSEGAAAADEWADRTREWGLDFVHETGGRGDFHLAEIMGGGVALFDADGDGDQDLLLANGNLDPAGGEARGDGPRNAFYRNDDGSFVEATKSSGLGDPGYGMGLAIGDVDNDDDLDVYVANFGLDRLYLNDGRGVFTDATSTAGLSVGGWSASSTFLDYDGDGWLDLFVTGYVRYQPGKRCTDAAGRDDYCGPSVFAPQPDTLLHNRGDGTFTDVTVASGISRGIGRGLGVVTFDANGDHRPDIYVANDGDPNHLWIQREDGRFVDEALLHGLAYNLAGETEAGMGVLAEDLDGDGELDLFVTHLTEESNTLYVRGETAFSDRSAESGLGAGSMPFTGFGVAAIDLELDGDLDLVVVNGRVSGGFDGHDGGSDWERFSEPNSVFRNLGGGRFEAVTWPSRGISRGIAVADLDGDGDEDWVVTNLQAPAQLWINEAAAPGHWLAVAAPGETGAVVLLDAGGRRRIRRIDPAGSYLSSGEPVARFGLGDITAVDGLWIRRADGTEQQISVDGVDRIVSVVP
jgi:hypothetical protein